MVAKSSPVSLFSSKTYFNIARPETGRGAGSVPHAVDYTAATLRLDPEWDPLRGEPAFAQLIAEAQAQEKSDAALLAK